MKRKRFTPNVRLKTILSNQPSTIKATNKDMQYCIERKYSDLVQRLNLKEVKMKTKLAAEDDTGKIVLKDKIFQWIPDPPLSEEDQTILDILTKN